MRGDKKIILFYLGSALVLLFLILYEESKWSTSSKILRVDDSEQNKFQLKQYNNQLITHPSKKKTKQFSFPINQKQAQNPCPSIDGVTVTYPYFCLYRLPYFLLFLSSFVPFSETVERSASTVLAIAVLSVKNFAIPPTIGQFTALMAFATFDSLTGSLPSELGLLKNLLILGIISADLSGSLPSEIGSLSKLESLALSGVHFNGEIPTEYGRLTTIYGIDISEGELDATIPSELGRLTRLTNLAFTFLGVKGKLPSQIGRLTNLSIFSTSGSKVEGTIPSEYGRFKYIEHFNLQNSRLTSLPSEIGLLTTLTYFDVHRNFINGTIPTQLGRLRMADKFDLSDNDFYGTLPSELAQFNINDTRILRVGNNSLIGSIPNEILANSLISIRCDYSGLDHSNCLKFEEKIDIEDQYLDQTILIIGFALAGAVILINIITSILVFVYRNTASIKAAHHKFTLLSLSGLLLMCLSIIPFGFSLVKMDNIEIRNYSCIFFPHFIIHGISILLSSISARNYPIWKTFDNPQFSRLTVTTSSLVYSVMGTFILSILIVIPVSVYSKANPEGYGCNNDSEASRYSVPFVCVYIAVLALSAFWMCFKTWNVPSMFNNTREIALATYVLITFGFGTIAAGLLSSNPRTLYLAIVLCIIVVVSTFLLLVTTPRLVKAIFPTKDKPKPLPNSQPPTAGWVSL